jgi:hypothetical protein
VDVKAALTTGTLLPTAGHGVEGGLYANLFPRLDAVPVRGRQRADGPLLPDGGRDRADRRGGGPQARRRSDQQTGRCGGRGDRHHGAVLRRDGRRRGLPPGLPPAGSSSTPSSPTRTRVLDTFAATSGVLTGTGAAADVVDRVADAIAGQEVISGSSPTAVIANPPPSPPSQGEDLDGKHLRARPTHRLPHVHRRVRVVSTPATPPGAAWVVSGNGVIIYRRGQLTAEIGLKR